MNPLACTGCNHTLAENTMVVFGCGMIRCEDCIKSSKHISNGKCIDHGIHPIENKMSKSIRVNDLVGIMRQMEQLLNEFEQKRPKVTKQTLDELDILKAQETIMQNEKQKLNISLKKVKEQVDGLKEEQARKKRLFQAENARLQNELKQQLDKERKLLRQLKNSQMKLSKLEKQYDLQAEKAQKMQAKLARTIDEQVQEEKKKKKRGGVLNPESKWLSALKEADAQEADDQESDAEESSEESVKVVKTYKFGKSREMENPFDHLD